MLDFDGTLVDLEERHDMPRLGEKMQNALRQLARTYPLVVISGRSLTDVKKRIGVRGIAYAGCHGLEWQTKTTRYAAPMPDNTKVAFLHAKKQLRLLAKKSKAIVEDKKYSFALHYRTLSAAGRRVFVQEAKKIIADTDKKRRLLRVINDQYTFDVMPSVAVSKGTCAKILFDKLKPSHRAVPIYIGDSQTDEDAFKAFSRGITIRVGKKAVSAAAYYVSDRADVDSFLLRLAQKSSTRP